MSPLSYAEVGNHRLAYHRSGSGETVVLVHGITTYSFLWEGVAEPLEEEFDVIAVDLLGCGDSDMPLDVSYAIQDHADRLYEFVTALGVERFHLVGHDLGGGVAQIFAVRHPEMLLDLTVANSVAYDFWPVQPITALRTPIIRQLLMATFDMGTFRLVIKRGVYHTERVDDALMAKFQRPLSTTEGRQAFMHFARCLDNHNLTDIADDIHALPMPVLIIRGDADPFLSAEISEKLHANIPGSRLEHIPTASHFVQIDEPEILSGLIAGFCREHPA
ncbi:MAG: alpha/beta fold hydrolase [Coriobacteriia bacterium]|nr:alpha/beta fold hydrolase [Coriobacteriia bacterium]